LVILALNVLKRFFGDIHLDVVEVIIIFFFIDYILADVWLMGSGLIDRLHKLLLALLLYISTPDWRLENQWLVLFCLGLDFVTLVLVLIDHLCILDGVLQNRIHALDFEVHVDLQISINPAKLVVIQRYALILRVIRVLLAFVQILLVDIRHGGLSNNSFLLKVLGIASVDLLKVVNLLSAISFCLRILSVVFL
jgi:hypothetical protein